MIVIEVRGLPAPQGSKRLVTGRGGSPRPHLIYNNSRALGPWREAIRAETQRVMNGTGPLDGALAVSVTFELPRPRGHYRTGRNAGLRKDSAPQFPAGRPDLDKLLRAVLDGLTEGGAWADDSQVVRIGAEKLYGNPGACIRINQWPLEGGT